MKKYFNLKDGYDAPIACFQDDFVRETTESNGTILMVVDRPSDKVAGYCIAVEGRWTDL